MISYFMIQYCVVSYNTIKKKQLYDSILHDTIWYQLIRYFKGRVSSWWALSCLLYVSKPTHFQDSFELYQYGMNLHKKRLQNMFLYYFTNYCITCIVQFFSICFYIMENNIVSYQLIQYPLYHVIQCRIFY